MGAFFSSFDEAWSFFLGRTEPLEDFFAEFPDDDDACVKGWMVEPPAEIKAAAHRLQEALAQVTWLVPVPDHFLHVAIGLSDRIGDVAEEWEDLEAFPITYANVNCFHAAVVVEVEGPMSQLVAGTPYDDSTFLPHMTLAVARQPLHLRSCARCSHCSRRRPRPSGRRPAHVRSLSGRQVDAV